MTLTWLMDIAHGRGFAASDAASAFDRPAGGQDSYFSGGKISLPVVLHVDDGPALLRGLVERLVELADVRSAIVGIFALGVGVVDDEAEPRRPCSPGRPLQHLQVAVGVAERRRSDGGR